MALSKHERIEAAKVLVAKLHYDPQTGWFTWAESRTNGIQAGDRAGSTEIQGYRKISFRYKGKEFCFKEHRLVWVYMTGNWPELSVDHINRVKDDNRFSNLRLATSSQQNGNQPGLGGSSRYRGVGLHSRGNCWYATIWIDGKNRHLGSFKSEIDAARAYDRAAIEKWGEFYTPQVTQVPTQDAEAEPIGHAWAKL